MIAACPTCGAEPPLPRMILKGGPHDGWSVILNENEGIIWHVETYFDGSYNYKCRYRIDRAARIAVYEKDPHHAPDGY